MSETGSTPHILVVEDDTFVRQVLEIYLTGEGYRVTLARDGDSMREAMTREPADLVIMDLRLPGEDGFTLTRYLREKHSVGIIILTTRNDIVDRVVGLECGADDYVTKPFEERELLARIRSVLRRTAANSSANGATQANGKPVSKLSFDGYLLDTESGHLKPPHGRSIELTGNECRLLAHLVHNSGRALNREDLMLAVLQREWDPMDRSIDVLITRLRHKIERDPKRPVIIKTVRGTGYMLSAETSLAHSAA